MLGNMTKDQFKPEENYDEFYGGHSFNPLDEHTALNADLVMPRVAWALDVARDIRAKSTLDLCCLDGFATLTLASKLTLERARGYDLSRPGIALAKQRALLLDAPHTDISFGVTSIETLHDLHQYDLVLLFEAIEHFTDPDTVMGVIKRHLKPGGTLLVSTPDAEGHYGIRNTEDVCHLRVYTHKHAGELAETTPEGKPVVSLPDYLTDQGFVVEDNDVWNELIHIRATI